jgi:signal transduction histidine kinase
MAELGLNMENAKKLFSSLVEPHPSVQGIRKRQQSRLLSSFLLLAIPIFAFVQFTSELVLFSTPVFLGAILAVFLVYLGTRTRYYDATLFVGLTGITLLPTIIFLFGASWQPSDLPRLMVWMLVALIAGALLANTAVVLVQGTAMILTMTSILTFVFHVPFSEFDSHIGTAVVVTFFVVIASYTLEQYVRQVDQRTSELYRKQWELEVYTQLLRHDLRNDLQAILSSVELADMFVDLDAARTKENLAQSLSLCNRMIQLLHVFSMAPNQPGTNLVKHIEEAALESQKAHRNLKIEVTSESDVGKVKFTASRLLPMVWQNIFRNAAQYAGEKPTVWVHIAMDGDEFVISIHDNGPGIPQDKREFLFRRGSKYEPSGSGIGLYLCKFVLEVHGGSINLVDDGDRGGTRFIIRLPVSEQ